MSVASTPGVSGAGRPRLVGRRRAGSTAREEVLDAAAELFSRNGYAATSTRAIADAVGIKQASLYYHFASKEQILFDLLLATVVPSRRIAGRLDATGASPLPQLWALAAADVTLLCSGRWNTGALYLLPEVNASRFAPFRAERQRLREDYGSLVAAAVRAGACPEQDVAASTLLVFALVETVIPTRTEFGDLDGATVAPTIADGCLRLLGCPARTVTAVHARGERLLASL